MFKILRGGYTLVMDFRLKTLTPKTQRYLEVWPNGEVSKTAHAAILELVELAESLQEQLELEGVRLC